MSLKKISNNLRFVLQYVHGINKLNAAYIAGFNNHHNLGDEAIYKGMKILFSTFNFIDYPKPLTIKKSLEFLSHIDIGLLAGGTIIRGKASTFERVKQCFDLCAHPVVFGTGVGDPEFWSDYLKQRGWLENLKRWKEILHKCDYIGLRGPLSVKILNNLGTKNVEVIGDPVLVLAEDENPTAENFCQKTIGLNLGQAKGNVWGSENHIYNEFVKLASLAKKNNWNVKWYVVWPRDFDVTLKAAKASNTDQKIYEIYHNHRKYIEHVKQLTAFIGMKLHAVALATCAYVPSLMIEYQPKCRDYMMSINQDKYNIRSDEFKAENTWESILKISNQRKNINDELFHKIRELKEKQLLQASKITKNLLP